MKLRMKLRESFGIRRERRRGLERFLEAQNRSAVRSMTIYDQAAYELHGGRKDSHWMWFIFPQRPGLGQSRMSRVYALTDREAVDYLKHPILGPRLRTCTDFVIVSLLNGRTLEQIFGSVDAMKFESCMALFRDVERDRRYYRTADTRVGQFEYAQLAADRARHRAKLGVSR